MSAIIAQVNISSLAPKPKPLSETVMVGKDILELLAGSMYLDPLNIYREYIQNSADAIDEARDQDLVFKEEPGVQIYFDHPERSLRIRDNGVSIPMQEFSRRLVTIGASQKRGKKLRGFRGVGRLSGLGYCQELIFRGRANGDAKVTEIRWDGRALREKMRDHTYEGDLADLVRDVVTETRLSTDGFPDRFFEVELRKVSRLRNDILLNEEVVRNYLSQVAPVPFSEQFHLANEIEEALTARGIRPPISITLNDGNGIVTRRIQDFIQTSEVVTDPIRSVDFIELKGSDGEVCAFGWIADHSYAGSIPKRLGLGGIRLRAGNIQVGDEGILSNLFPEPRFAGWAIGEVHILSQKILPNGRRDDFEPSAAYAHLQAELTLQARNITQRIRERSAQRNQLRVVQQHFAAVDIWLQIANEKSLPSMILHLLHDLSNERLEKAAKESSRLPEDSYGNEATLTRAGQLQTLVNKLGASHKTLHVKSKISEELKKPISAALKTILSTAKSADAGIGLSIEVLTAIENAS